MVKPVWSVKRYAQDSEPPAVHDTDPSISDEDQTPPSPERREESYSFLGRSFLNRFRSKPRLFFFPMAQSVRSPYGVHMA
jgi:hypothetical protein